MMQLLELTVWSAGYEEKYRMPNIGYLILRYHQYPILGNANDIKYGDLVFPRFISTQ